MRQHSTTTMELVGFVSNRGKPIEMSSELKADKLQVTSAFAVHEFFPC